MVAENMHTRAKEGRWKFQGGFERKGKVLKVKYEAGNWS